jgi:hypothetical protein
MKQTKLFFALFALFALCAAPAFAMDDSTLKVSQTNATVDATNYTAAIDLGTSAPATVWKQAYLRAEIPALAKCTNSAVTRLFNLQTSTNNSTWVVPSPAVQGQIVGATAATNTATTIKLPIPPDVKRYIRIQQINPAAGGDDSTVTNVFWLTVP